MPSAGTKKTQLANGVIRFLPEEESVLERCVQRGLELQARIERDEAELANLKAEVAKIGERHRGTRQSLRLTAPAAGVASITWSQETKVDATRAMNLREKLGPLWARVFATKTEVRLAKSYQDTMRSGKEEVKKHDGAIAACIEVRPKKPAVKFEEPV